MLEQDPPPSQLIVVDSSDDHEVTVKVVTAAAAGAHLDLIILRSARGLTLQRNRGLEEVKHPIVFFPDDDSIFFPGVAKSILAVYHRDTEWRISAVCAYESLTPPPGFLPEVAGYAMAKSDTRKQRVLKYRARIEGLLFPDPIRSYAQTLIKNAVIPSWTAELQIVPVEWMTGFRMTFRTDAVKKHGFDERLTRYALFEDRDISLMMWREGAVMATPDARIFHYRSPEKRDNGRRMGAQQMLNLAYLSTKHIPQHHPSRFHLSRFCRYKLFLYGISARDSFSRERREGARAAYSMINPFVRADSSEAQVLYESALAACLPHS